MHIKKALLFISIFALFYTANAQVMWQFNKDKVVTWQYEWGDEFNDSKINEEKWKFDLGWARSIFGNREQQYYTENKNHILENDVLKLVARKEGIDARTCDGAEDNDTLKVDGKFFSLNKRHFNYTSGMINSQRLFKYGYFEIRFKAPKDKGMWPAFWLAGGYPNEEIDVFELKGERPNKAHVDIHCPNDCDYFKSWYGKKVKWGGWLTFSENLTEGFNVMAVEWQPDYVKFYLNGKSIGFVKVNFAVEKSLLANLALPANNGPFHPGPDASFTESKDYEIDYIRTWALPDLKAKQKSAAQPGSFKTSVSDLKESKSELKKKNKFIFGKKADHVNEGLTVSLVPSDEKSYILYILGDKPADGVTVELTGEDGRQLFTGKYSEFQNKLDLSKLPRGKFNLSVSYDGKKAETRIEL